MRAAQELNVDPPAAVASPCSFALACEAIDAVEPSRVGADEALAELGQFAKRPQTVEYARQLATTAAKSWWTAPLNSSSQGWFSRTEDTPPAAPFQDIQRELTAWERYAQKPESCLWTSTLRSGTTSAVAAVQAGSGDLGAAGPVTSLWSLTMAGARVYVVGSAADWHELCRQYPGRGEDGRLVPHWKRVGEAWDAVHLSFAGVMTATGVRVESAAGWTTLTGWDIEQTVWLWWRIDLAARIPVPRPAQCE